MVETINKLIRVSRQLLQEHGRELSLEEIVTEMDIPVEKVREIMKIAQIISFCFRPAFSAGELGYTFMMTGLSFP